MRGQDGVCKGKGGSERGLRAKMVHVRKGREGRQI